MATENEIRDVREMLGPDAADGGYGDNRIEEELDNGSSPNLIAYKWWSLRAATTYKLTNVSESGSSRTLNQVHEQAAKMRNYYKGLVDKDLEGAKPDTEAKRGPGIRTFPIRRIART